MDTLEAINKRFSVRTFLDKKVSWEKIATLLDAAIKAPSSGNLQNFRFIIIEDEVKKREIANACYKQLWINEAPILIIVCADLTNIKRFYHDKLDLYSTQNCAAATENILLAATELNLGSCWVSAFDDKELIKILILPINIKPQVVIPIGYTNEKQPIRKRYDLKDFISYEEYGKTKDISLFPLQTGRLTDISKEIKRAKKPAKEFFNKLKKKILKK